MKRPHSADGWVRRLAAPGWPAPGPQGHARVLAQHAHGFMRAQHIYYAHLHTELINGI